MIDFRPSERILALLPARQVAQGARAPQLIPVLVAPRRAGQPQFPNCAFQGFFGPEQVGDTPMAWTEGQAMIQIRFLQPTGIRYVWLELAATRPQGSRLQLTVAGKRILDRVVRGRCVVRGRLPEEVNATELTLVLDSETFVPCEQTPGSADSRRLGVAVSRVVLARKRNRYRSLAQRLGRVWQRLRKVA